MPVVLIFRRMSRDLAGLRRPRSQNLADHCHRSSFAAHHPRGSLLSLHKTLLISPHSFQLSCSLNRPESILAELDRYPLKVAGPQKTSRDGNQLFLLSTPFSLHAMVAAISQSHTRTPSTSSQSSDEPIAYAEDVAPLAPKVVRTTRQARDWRPRSTLHLKKFNEMSFAEKVCSLALTPETIHGACCLSLASLTCITG